MQASLIDELGRAFAPHGLVLRGGFNFGSRESVPAASGRLAKTVLLIGNAGAAYWPRFMDWREGQPANLENPLDTWCREVIGKVAEAFGARAVSPSDRPFLPFQQWAMRAEGLKSSPLGILMHPEYGLWHAYRGALLFDREIAAAPPAFRPPLPVRPVYVPRPSSGNAERPATSPHATRRQIRAPTAPSTPTESYSFANAFMWKACTGA